MALRRRRGFIIGGVVVLVVLLAGVGAIAWYALGDDAPPPPKLADAPGADPAGAGSPDGTWTLGAKPGYVGYRVEELFAGETLRKDAVGRTTDVTGTLVFANGQLQSVDITANADALKSDRAPRDSFLRSNALETDKLPDRHVPGGEPGPARAAGHRQGVQGPVDRGSHDRTASLGASRCS